MAMNEMGAGFTLRAYDRATPILRRVGAGFRTLRGRARAMAGGMNKALGATATGFMALRAGLGMVKLAKAAGDAAADFGQSLEAVGQITRSTADELETLRGAAIEAALATKFSPDEAIEGLKVLGQQGLRAAEAAKVLKPALDLATGSMGQLGIEGAASAVVGSLRAMRMEMDEAGNVTNKLLKITQMTNFQAGEFEHGLSKAAAAGGMYKQSLDDVLISLGLVRNLNISASVASTGLRAAYARLAADQNTQQMVKDREIDIFDKQTHKIRSLLDVMVELSASFEDATDRESFLTSTMGFGRRGMMAFAGVAAATYNVMKDGEKIVLHGMEAINAMRYELSATGDVLDENAEASLRATLGVRDLSEVLGTSTRVAEQFREKLLDTYKGQKQLIGGAWETLKVVMGEDFAEAMKPIAAAIYETVSALAMFIKSLSPEAKRAIFKFVVALGSLVALGGGLMLLSGILNMLGGSLIGFVFSVGKLVLIGTPLVMLLGSMGIGFTALGKAFKKTAEGGLDLRNIMDKIRLAASGMMSIITGENFSDDLKKELDKAENQGVVKFLDKFEGWTERIGAFWKGLKQGFERGVEALSRSSAFRRLQDKIRGIIQIFTGPEAENSDKVLENWRDKGEGAGRSLASLGESAAKTLETIADLTTTIIEFVKGITADDIKKGIIGFVDAMRTLGDVWFGIKTAFKSIAASLQLIGSVIADAVVNLAYFYSGQWTKINWKWSTEAFKDIGGIGEGIAERYGDTSRYTAEARYGVGSAGKALEETRAKGNIVAQIIEGASKLRTAGIKGELGEKRYDQLSGEQQMVLLKELQKINRGLMAMGEKPITINMDGEKVAEVQGRAPSNTGEDDLDDAALVAP